MKFILKNIGLFAMICALYIPAKAQNDARAKVVLAKMSKKYKSYTSISGNFTLTIAQEQQKQVQKGTILMKGSQYHITFPSQELISDGKQVWSWAKDDKLVQITAANDQAASFSPDKIFSFYEKGYKYLLEPDQKKGNMTYQIVELSPIAASPYFKIRLWIQKSTTSLYSVEVFSKDATRFTYTLSSLQTNKAIPETTFSYNKAQHPGVAVEDLR